MEITKKIFFRADGNAQIGLGHIMRCLALAEMLGSEYERRFAVAQPSPEVTKLIKEKDVTVVPLSGSDVSEFLRAVMPDEVVVLDGYAFNEPYQWAVRNKAKKLVYIDDLTTGNQLSDVLINHAGGITQDDYQAAPYTQLLLGPHYALLRPEFFKDFGPTPMEGSIFVSLGGADPQNTSLTILDALRLTFRQLGQSWRVHIVVGPFHPNRPSIDSYQDKLKHLTILSNLTAEQMAIELKKCQLAITACSTVSYEVCAVNRPLVAIQTADNQSRLASFLRTEELAIEVLLPDNPIDRIANTIQIGLRHPAIAAPTLVNQQHYFDKKTPERFRALFDRLCSPTA